MATINRDWWRDYVISVPRPIPAGYMVGMRDEVRDGKHYVVEFLEKVPEYQPNPSSVPRRSADDIRRDSDALDLCIDFERDGEVILSWSRKRGVTREEATE